MNFSDPILLWLLAFPIFLAGIWLGICALAANISGWTKMAKVYQTQRTPSGKNYKFASGRIGAANYNGVLEIHVDREGIYLKPFVLFQFQHPTLFLPWNRIRELGSENNWVFQSTILEILGNHAESIARIQLPEKIFQEFKSYLHKT